MGGEREGEKRRDRSSFLVKERLLIDVFEEEMTRAFASGHGSPPSPTLECQCCRVLKGIFLPWVPRTGDMGTCSAD